MVGGLQPVLRDIMQNTALNIDALSVAAVSLNTMLVMSTATSPRGQLIETNVLFGLTVWNSCPFFVFFLKQPANIRDLLIGPIPPSLSAARVLELS